MLLTFLMRMVQGEEGPVCILRLCNATATSGHQIQCSIIHGETFLLQSGHVMQIEAAVTTLQMNHPTVLACSPWSAYADSDCCFVCNLNCISAFTKNWEN